MGIKLCGAFELALRAHDETSTSDNPGIYVGLVNFTAVIDALLAIHMKGSQVFKGISKTIQNEFVQTIPDFDNKVIEVFFSRRARRMDVIYKKYRYIFFVLTFIQSPRAATEHKMPHLLRSQSVGVRQPSPISSRPMLLPSSALHTVDTHSFFLFMFTLWPGLKAYGVAEATREDKASIIDTRVAQNVMHHFFFSAKTNFANAKLIGINYLKFQECARKFSVPSDR
nr:unnamed protein product [Callosobruchus analis]